jgi:predicted metal-dependent phosphoesterase TrpH
MDLVAITDHNAIDGAMTLAHLPDVIVGCEVSARLPERGGEAHLGVLDITPDQFREIERRRGHLADLLPYLRAQRIFTTLNHPASQVNGRMRPEHLAAIIPWVDAIEVTNGSRLASQNRTALALAAASRRAFVGGSDSHASRGLGRTYTVVDGARTREEFFRGLRRGRARVVGRHGSPLTMTSDILRFTTRFYQEQAERLIAPSSSWARRLGACASIGLLPIAGISVLYALAHFVEEARFNRVLRAGLADCGWHAGVAPSTASELA